MDPKLAFWTFALMDLFAVMVFALLGVRAIRRRQLRVHQRFMITSGSLVVLFLASYVLKVILLGRESLSTWSFVDRSVLYVHELCVAAMLLGGGYALWRALRFRSSLPAGGLLPRDESPAADRGAHRRAGWVAVVGGVFGFVTAIAVLAGMYARA
jgi:uncharacterized membrane protein YozB (DUF420 family)